MSVNLNEVVEEFLKKLTSHPVEYLRQFLVTLEINKLERDYQQPDQPCVFRKVFDEFGIVQSFQINPVYVTVPTPQVIFTQAEFEAGAELIERELEPEGGVAAMVLCGHLEFNLLENLGPDSYFGGPPFLLRKVDENGIPESYQLNPHCVTVG